MGIWHKTVKDLLVILEQDPLDSKSEDKARKLMEEIDLSDIDEYNQIWDDIEEGSKLLKDFIQIVHHNCRSLIQRSEWAKARQALLEADRFAEQAKKKFARVRKEIVKL